MNPENEGKLKWTLLKVAAAAAGITLALGVIVALILWYVSRPKPLKPWNEKALVASDSPGFDSYCEKDPTISLSYSVKNTTSSDYSVETPQRLRIMAVLESGELSVPIDSEHAVVRTPIFIPAYQLGTIVLHLKGFHAPAQIQSESNENYHERLRQHMNDRMSTIRGFVLFDDANRYQINLRRWEKKKPEAGVKP